MRSYIASKTFKEIQRVQEQFHHLAWKYWVREVVFTWQWWLLVFLTIVPLIIWWRFVDKKRVYEIAFFGCMLNLMAILLDSLGTQLLWWAYPINIIPNLPPLFPADSVLVPVILMFIYQVFSSSWKMFIVANLIASAILAFAAEPLFMWIGYYELNQWKLFYSFLFYITSSLLARFVILRIVK